MVSDNHRVRDKRRQKDDRGKVDVFSAMDVTVYPHPPQPLAASDHTRLGQLSYPDPSFGTNKVSGDGRNLEANVTSVSARPRDVSHVYAVLF